MEYFIEINYFFKQKTTFRIFFLNKWQSLRTGQNTLWPQTLCLILLFVLKFPWRSDINIYSVIVFLSHPTSSRLYTIVCFHIYSDHSPFTSARIRYGPLYRRNCYEPGSVYFMYLIYEHYYVLNLYADKRNCRIQRAIEFHYSDLCVSI